MPVRRLDFRQGGATHCATQSSATGRNAAASGKGFQMTDISNTSNSFQRFIAEAPAHQAVWLQAVQGLGAASTLDAKTQCLVYIGILAALRLEGGVAFHVLEAKAHGASRDDIISAVLTGLPAAGNGVLGALGPALEAFDKA